MAESKPNPHEGHRERLRRRFLDAGLEGFQEHEVLELLLTYAIPRVDVNGRAHLLLERFGSLAAVFDAPLTELMKVDGVGERAAGLIKLLPQLMRSYQLSRLKRERDYCLDSSQKAGAYLLPYFIGREEEHVYLLCLDPGNHPLNCVLLGKGTETAAAVPIKKLVETAVRERAHGVILAHNHPGGTMAPSQEDLDATKAAKAALETVGIRLLDHLIVAGDNYCSLREEGYL